MQVLPDKNTLVLLRIPFSFLLMPVFLLALSQHPQIIPLQASIAFLIIHLLVYPASNGYNSYVDRDVEAIGGLEHPPLPTPYLFYLTCLMDAAALVCAYFLVSPLFALFVAGYILISRTYSSKQIRLKKYPLPGFLAVVLFQGGFTYIMSWLGAGNIGFDIYTGNIYILLACSLQIAGVYPLTQVYQHQADLKDGVRTISYILGINGTFIFTAIVFAGCNVCYYLYFNETGKVSHFWVLQAFFVPVVAFFVYWFARVIKNQREANFKNTMRMNVIAACCMNACFALLLILNLNN